MVIKSYVKGLNKNAESVLWFKEQCNVFGASINKKIRQGC